MTLMLTPKATNVTTRKRILNTKPVTTLPKIPLRPSTLAMRSAQMPKLSPTAKTKAASVSPAMVQVELPLS